MDFRPNMDDYVDEATLARAKERRKARAAAFTVRATDNFIKFVLGPMAIVAVLLLYTGFWAWVEGGKDTDKFWSIFLYLEFLTALFCGTFWFLWFCMDQRE